MNRQEYLEQISASNRPVKSRGTKFNKILSSKFFLVGLIFVVAFVIIMVVGAILGGNKNGAKEKAFALDLHITYDMGVIEKYQKLVKSSDLRSDSTSLYSVLSNTSRDLENFLKDTYGNTDAKKAIGEKKQNELALQRDGLESELFEAKINGTLDTIYARKLSYEISLLMNEEYQIYSTTGNDTLKGLIDTSYNSLKNLYDKINGFSES
ncbi:hypothetical protein IKF32_02060 [Candidatus Saccharibacteria bacterium]|nr:hypothetical protein [Candidatus Saccharibacteria bacterium]